MTDLVSRLLEAIEEAERLARAANTKQDDPEWYAHHVAGSYPRTFRVRSRQDHCPIAEVSDLEDDGEVLDPMGVLDGESAAHHIAHNDPSSVLRRCAADRKLIERDGPFCDCGERRPPTNPDTGQPIPHHYDCSAYEAAQILAEGYGLSDHQEGGE